LRGSVLLRSLSFLTSLLVWRVPRSSLRILRRGRLRVLWDAKGWRGHVIGKRGHGLYANRRRHERHGLRKGVWIHVLLRLSSDLWLCRKGRVYVGDMRSIRRGVCLRRWICAVLLLRCSASRVVVSSSRASSSTMRIAAAFTTLTLPASARTTSPTAPISSPSAGTTSLACIRLLRVVRCSLGRRRRWGRKFERH
jgi:hypothetical protein